MTRDPLVDEIRRVREAHAKKFAYDLDAIFDDLKAQERASRRKFVRLPPRRRIETRAELRKHG